MTTAPAKEDALAEVLRPAFRDAAFRVDRSRPLTFVCGGKDVDGSSALRRQFLVRATRQPMRIVPVLAERTFAHQMVERNLQTFETFLASSAECVLIFVESPGSFAETGLFAALPKIISKTFVVNTREQTGENSFLNNGPIKLIRKKSLFDTVYELADSSVTARDADAIVERIISTCTRYERPLVFQRERKFSDLGLLLQLGCVHIAVTLVRAASSELVTGILRKYFRAVDQGVVERHLSLLTGINLLSRTDELYFNPREAGLEGDALIRLPDFSASAVRAKALEWQNKHNSHAAAFIREVLGVGL